VGSALVEPGGRTVHLRLESCNTTQQQAEVVESADEIRVTVRVQGGDPEEACQDSMIVQLTDRRGNRPLIDETTGDEIPLDDG
jgi:hypothetical protein